MNLEARIPTIHFENDNVSFLISNAVAAACTLVVVLSILYDFAKFHRPKQHKRKVNSRVETGSMFVYSFIYFLLMKPDWGQIHIQSELFFTIIQSIAIILLIAGCYVNIKGRMTLQHHWANQVTIYHNHTLITHGVYKWVRHPLYASLIWMFVAGSLIYCSYLSLSSVIFIFVPMMYYRARQEECLLEAEFPEYALYRQWTGMFFPKIV